MAKGAYIGVDGVARKIKKGYVGVDGVARKIKKAYIGIGGVARPCWGGGPIEYYGKITSMDAAMCDHVGVSAGNYAIFAGGMTTGSQNSVNAYNSSLVRTVAPDMVSGREDFAGAYIAENGYTIFAGGEHNDEFVAVVDTYNSSLTQITSEEMSTPRSRLASATVGKYAVFAGGEDANGDRSKVVEYFYDGTSNGYVGEVIGSSVRSTEQLKTASYYVAGGDNGAYALFYNWYRTDYVDAYNSSMTHSAITNSIPTKDYVAIGRAGDYAIVAGGTNNAGNNIAIDQSLTVTFVDDLQEGRRQMKSTSLGKYAMFIGGYIDSTASRSAKVDLYDSSLVHTVATDLSVTVDSHAAASVGNYALVAGGNRGDNNYAYSTTVEAYVLNEQQEG